ncbi:hypothetical protein [Clostridium botulinum]|uniref:hypothetical protein n=1 Tax=Clostridium botulinum TaxID=1491 RepID=UPI001C9AF33D|nr:hypothetical protein [Clostridium botulinum]MBY6810797.1 hypothetical protein [Clostridium botulinum]MBY6824208.1 hypothetical protein [Clostridium botulinum]MBY6834662.1 hypothetical protein [Clostridium botulinum]MBY6973374.1 hypothetical protein [Clostridium botulinum]MCS6104390.1 hypothetical protein [Clostridium botulinum]
MIKDIEAFCKVIEKEYIYYLYKNNESFPNCCQTSANLIASYLYVHYDNTFKHKKLINHGWTGNDECMIDFTGSQFSIPLEMKNKLRYSNKLFNQEDIYNIVKKSQEEYPVFATSKSYYYNSWNNWEKIKPEICDLYGVEFAKEIQEPYTLSGFMQYVQNALNVIDKKVISARIY